MLHELKNPNPEIVATLECGCQYFRSSGVRVHTCKKHESGVCVVCGIKAEALSPQGHGLCLGHQEQAKATGELKWCGDWTIRYTSEPHPTSIPRKKAI